MSNGEPELDYEHLQDHPADFVETVIGVEPFDYQRAFMENDATRKAFVSGRQVGKSRTASWLALWYAVTHPGSLVLVTADALRQSSELFTQLQSEMRNAGLTESMWGVDRSTQTTIEFEHGSRIKVVPTGRNGNKIRGFTADYIVVDEAAFVDDSIFEDVIEPMTFVTGGTIVLCSTPFGTSGYFYEKATHPDWYSTWDPNTGGISSDDNPAIDQSDIDEYREGKTRAQIRREAEGRFVEQGDVFFPPSLIRSTMHTSVGTNTGQIICGVDVAGAGDAETVVALSDYDGNVFTIESYNKPLPEERRRIQDLHNHYDFEQINIDYGGVGTGFVEELSERVGRRTINGIFLSTKNKEDVYQTFKARLQNDEVALCHDNSLKRQMENLGYSRTANGTLRIQPKSDEYNDDYPDAVALAVYGLPGAAGSGNSGARGMKTATTIGELRDTGDGRRGYTISSDAGTRQSDDDAIDRTIVGSSRTYTERSE
jgi:hypothetical protein